MALPTTTVLFKTQPRSQGLSSSGGKMRDPGNEVVQDYVHPDDQTRSNSTYFWNDSWVQTFHSYTEFCILYITLTRASDSPPVEPHPYSPHDPAPFPQPLTEYTKGNEDVARSDIQDPAPRRWHSNDRTRKLQQNGQTKNRWAAVRTNQLKTICV